MRIFSRKHAHLPLWGYDRSLGLTTSDDLASSEPYAAAPAAEEGGIHKEIKVKFIEGTASFMSLVAIALVIGLAFCIERIIYLSLAEINTKKLVLLLMELKKTIQILS